MLVSSRTKAMKYISITKFKIKIGTFLGNEVNILLTYPKDGACYI